MMLCDISLYTPGGLFLDMYENVDHGSVWMPGKEHDWIRFREPKTMLEIKTSLPFLLKLHKEELHEGH